MKTYFEEQSSYITRQKKRKKKKIRNSFIWSSQMLR